jgi:hypothetical protein
MKCNNEAKSFACSPFTRPLQAYNGHITQTLEPYDIRPYMNQTGSNPPISQFIWVKFLLLKIVVGWDLLFFKKRRVHILHFPNSTGLFTKSTGRHYTQYRFSHCWGAQWLSCKPQYMGTLSFEAGHYSGRLHLQASPDEGRCVGLIWSVFMSWRLVAKNGY